MRFSHASLWLACIFFIRADVKAIALRYDSGWIWVGRHSLPEQFCVSPAACLSETVKRQILFFVDHKQRLLHNRAEFFHTGLDGKHLCLRNHQRFTGF